MLTFDFMLGLLSPPLELFAVVVEPLEAHDAVLEAGAATRGDMKGHKGSPSPPGHMAGRDLSRDFPLCVLPPCPKDASGQGWVRTDTTQIWKIGNVPPFHGNSPLHQFEPAPATCEHTDLNNPHAWGLQREEGTSSWGLRQAEGFTPGGDPGRPMGQGRQWESHGRVGSWCRSHGWDGISLLHWAAGRQQWSTGWDEPEVLPMVCFTARGRPDSLQFCSRE